MTTCPTCGIVIYRGVCGCRKEREMKVLTYDGTFDLRFLRDGESVRSAGDDTDAVIVKTPTGETRLELGDSLIRTHDGHLISLEASKAAA
jgi:hypothetical protein